MGGGECVVRALELRELGVLCAAVGREFVGFGEEVGGGAGGFGLRKGELLGEGVDFELG